MGFICLVVACVAFVAAAVLGPPFEGFRLRCIAVGLAFWALSSLFAARL